MMLRLLTLLLVCSHAGAEISALYLSWYADPTTTMAIQWHTPLEETSDDLSLEHPSGEWVPIQGSHLTLGPRLVHKALLEGLSPDSEYSFRIGKDPALYKFRTAPKDLTRPLKFLIGGDVYQNPKLFRKMNQALVEKNPLFAVLGGDIGYARSANPFRLKSSEMNRWFAFLREWKEQMILPDGQVIPFVLVAGNHDIATDDYEFFFSLFAYPKRQLYRALDFGNYLSLILLDTGHFHPIDGMQTDWLERTLGARTSIPYLFPVYHIAAYPSFYSFTGSDPEKIRANWCPLFDKYNIKAAFENHNHAFKRTFPIRANKQDPSGTIYLGDGCWGAKPRATNDMWYLEKRARKNNVYLLELTNESAKIEAIDLLGHTIDSLKITP